MWETPDGLPAAAGHDPLLLFADDAGHTTATRTAASVWLRPGCRCGWDGGGGLRIPPEVPATGTHPGNHAEVQAAVTAAGEGLRARWWREHLVVVAPAAELAAAMPALRLDDPALADAVASAWVAGASWAEIGAAVGVARQVAWKRWHHTVHPGPPRTLAPAADGRPRRRELPAPGGWPGRPGWAHPVSRARRHPLPHRLWGHPDRPGTGRGHRGGGLRRPGLCVRVARHHGRGPRRPPRPAAGRAGAAGRSGVRARRGTPTCTRRCPPPGSGPGWPRPAPMPPTSTASVAAARDRGASWAAIAAAVGISPQGAWDRWSTPHPTGPDATSPQTTPTPARRHPKRSQTTVLRAHHRR